MWTGKIWSTIWMVGRVPAGAQIEGSRNFNWSRMAEEENADEGMLEDLLFSLFLQVFLFKVTRFHDPLSFVIRYQKRKVDWRRMKKNKRRRGKESVSMRSSGKEQEKRGFVSAFVSKSNSIWWHLKNLRV